MNIIIGTIVLACLAAWIWGKLETPDRRGQALHGVRRMVIMNSPRMIIALISAGLYAELLPDDLVRQYLGDSSGMTGVVIGTVLGIFTPGGAFVSFAIAAGALAAGATHPAMIAYITAWALFAVTKVIAEEYAFMGGHFMIRRVLVSAPLPLIAGGAALLV